MCNVYCVLKGDRTQETREKKYRNLHSINWLSNSSAKPGDMLKQVHCGEDTS